MNLTPEPVLCISREALIEQKVIVEEGCKLYDFNIKETANKNFHFLHRSLCDSKEASDVELAERLPQVLPYCTVRCGDKYLSYSRAKGAEDRLHGSLSIGFGGHVDITDYQYKNLNLQQSLGRELREELGAVYDNYIIAHTSKALVDTTNEVGRVHLGIYFQATLPKEDWVRPDVSEIHLPVWQTRQELLAEIDRYENWSQAIIKSL